MTDKVHPWVEALPECRTLNGKFSAYCEVCWNPVYAGWIDSEPHGGVCPSGATQSDQCADAMGRAAVSANLTKLRKQGLIA